MRKLRVGIIGLGVGLRHIPAFVAHPACEVAVLCDLDPAALAQGAELCPQARLAAKASEVLDDPSLDAVSIASYDDVHYEQTCRALDAGKHVFVEKPLCLHPSEAAEIRARLRARPDLRLSSNLNLRACPRFERLRRDVAEGRMGRLFHLEADYLWGRTAKLTEGWRGRMAFYSIALGASVHMIDLVLWITGEKPVEVSALGGRLATAGTGFAFDDMNVALLRFPDGLTAKVSALGGCVHPHFHRLAAFGTQATFVQDYGRAYVLRSSDPAAPADAPEGGYPAAPEKARMITSFLDAILDPSLEPLAPADAVFDALCVCFAAEESAATGRPVPVTYL